jgi:hypothetical protein
MSYSPITSKLSAVIFWIVKGTLRADSTLKKMTENEGKGRPHPWFRTCLELKDLLHFSLKTLPSNDIDLKVL